MREPASGARQAAQRAEHRRLARAVGAEQHHQLAVADLELDLAHRLEAAVRHGEAGDLSISAAPGTRRAPRGRGESRPACLRRSSCRSRGP